MSIQLKQYQLNYYRGDSFQQKEILNQELDFLQTLSRISQLNEQFSKNPDWLNTISSYIYILNSTSTITGSTVLLSQTLNSSNKLAPIAHTDHYQNFLKLNVPNDLAYPQELIEDLIYTGRNTWATELGTLGYFLNFNYSHASAHNLNPGELAYKSVISFLSHQSQTRNLKLSQIYLDYLSLAQQPTEENALLFFDLTVDIWQGLDCRQVFKLLEFMESFLPELMTWYLNLNPIKKINKVEIELEKIARLCLTKNLDFSGTEAWSDSRLSAVRSVSKGRSESFNFKHDFVFGNLPPIYLTLFKEILAQRSLMLDDLKIELLEDSIPGEALLKKYLSNIPLGLDVDLIKNKYLQLVSQLAPPGGFNLLLVTVANFLLANAYNLLARTTSELTLEYPTVNQFCALAGNCLLRTNLNHLQILGKNLLVLANLNLNINPDELMTINY
jgi:hypothetical protein